MNQRAAGLLPSAPQWRERGPHDAQREGPRWTAAVTLDDVGMRFWEGPPSPA